MPAPTINKSNSSYGNYAVHYTGKYASETAFFFHKADAITFAATLCQTCGREIEPLTEFPNPNGAGLVCLPCYERHMDNAPMPTAAEITGLFRKAVNI